jgi:hypothetical protein
MRCGSRSSGGRGAPRGYAQPRLTRRTCNCAPLPRPQERERGDEDMVEVSRGSAFVIVNETKVKVDLTKYIERHQVPGAGAEDEGRRPGAWAGVELRGSRALVAAAAAARARARGRTLGGADPAAAAAHRSSTLTRPWTRT